MAPFIPQVPEVKALADAVGGRWDAATCGARRSSLYGSKRCWPGFIPLLRYRGARRDRLRQRRADIRSIEPALPSSRQKVTAETGR